MSHEQHDHVNGDEWNAHISDHWGMHGGGHEPVQETEPWSIHTDAAGTEHDEADGWHDIIQHEDDDHASHPMPEDDMHHVDDIHHMDPMVHEPEEREPDHELPHVHISVEPPPSGSAPLAVEDYDHPMAPVAPPTPPLTDQAMKDSSAAGEEAADAAMRMGCLTCNFSQVHDVPRCLIVEAPFCGCKACQLNDKLLLLLQLRRRLPQPMECQPAVFTNSPCSEAFCKRCLLRSHDQQAAAAKAVAEIPGVVELGVYLGQEAADHARWSAGTSSTQPPIPEHFEEKLFKSSMPSKVLGSCSP